MKFRVVYVNDSAFDSMVRIVDENDDVQSDDILACDAAERIERLNTKYMEFEEYKANYEINTTI